MFGRKFYKNPPFTLSTYFIIRDYKEYNTDTAVHFIVMMNRDKLLELERDGLHKAFKLQTTTTITSMVRLAYRSVSLIT